MCLPKCLYCTGWMNKHITNIWAIEIRRHCRLNNWRCIYWLNLQTLYLSIQPIHLQTLRWQCCLIEIFPEAYPNLCGQRVMQTTYHLKALARCLRIPRESHSSSWWLLTRCEVWHHIQDGPRDLGPFKYIVLARSQSLTPWSMMNTWIYDFFDLVFMTCGPFF